MNAPTFHAGADSALLDPIASLREARALRSWRDEQKASVIQRLAALHRAWSAEWIAVRNGSSNEAPVHVSEPEGDLELTTSQWRASWHFAASPHRADLPGQTGRVRDGHSHSQAAIRAIAQRMFASEDATANARAPMPSKIAADVAHAAWNDWLQRIGNLVPDIELEPQKVEEERRGRRAKDLWSGTLIAHWPWCGGTWTLVLPHEAVSRLLAADAEPTTRQDVQRSPRERLDRVLAGRTIPLRIMLKGAELSLGQLQDLRLHDVVALEHALDAPAQVVNADGSALCDGWLGKVDGHVAIELALPSAHEPQTNTHLSKERKQ